VHGAKVKMIKIASNIALKINVDAKEHEWQIHYNINVL